MSKSPLNRPFACDPAPTKTRRMHRTDPEWGRPQFRAPDLCNPRIVFDPLPFRTQSLWTPRPARSS